MKKLKFKKLKLKSVYTRYMLIFMAIMFFTVAILGILVTTIAGNYATETKKNELSETNRLFRTTVLAMDGEYETLEEKLKANESELRENLSFAFFAMSDCGVVITDNKGYISFLAYRDSQSGEPVIFYGNEINASIINKKQIDIEIMKEIYKNRNIYRDSDLADFFTKSVNLYATAISQAPIIEDTTDKDSLESGKLTDKENSSTEDVPVIPEIDLLGKDEEGVVITFAGAQGQPDMADDMMQSIIISVIWISLCALVAIYGFSYSVMKPLRDISDAAKAFSHGKYDVRVKVQGDDEIAELATSFNNLVTVVQAREEMQNTFLSNASHDLRTPMTTIAGFIDGILDGAIPPEKQDYYLNVIKSEIKRLNRLVSSLLDISRLQSGERKFEMKSFNICELVRQTVISFENQLEEKNLDVEFDLDDFDINVIGDKDAINQVVYNLCHNAIKFSHENGKYKVSIKDEGDKVRFIMYNEGIGITKEEIPFVFDRFFKSDKSRGLDKTGAGLGLFISKTVIEAHDEEIKVNSEYGKYCELSFTLKKA